MSVFLWVVLVTTIVGFGGAGMGGLISCCIRRESDVTVSILLSFASGIMLSVVCFDLIPEALTQNMKSGLVMTIIGILAGYVSIFGINELIERSMDSEDSLRLESIASRNRHELFTAGIVMASAIAVHNLPEGMVIGAAYASDAVEGNMAGSGLVLAIVIGLHDIPEGMAVAVPLIGGGIDKPKAVLLSVLSGAPTILGAAIGFMIGSIGPVALNLSLSYAGGAMLYVIFGELLPESNKMCSSKIPAFAILAGILAGVLIVYC